MPKMPIVNLAKDKQVLSAGFYRFGNEYTALYTFFTFLLNIIKSNNIKHTYNKQIINNKYHFIWLS